MVNAYNDPAMCMPELLMTQNRIFRKFVISQCIVTESGGEYYSLTIGQTVFLHRVLLLKVIMRHRNVGKHYRNIKITSHNHSQHLLLYKLAKQLPSGLGGF